MKCLLTTLFCLMAIMAQAWQRIPVTTSWLRVHHRMPVEEKTKYILKVAEEDSTAGYKLFMATVNKDSGYDFFNRDFVNLKISTFKDGVEKEDSTLTFPLYEHDKKRDGLSFRLSLVKPGRIKIEFGQTEALFNHTFNIKGNGFYYEVVHTGKSKPLREDVKIIAAPDIEKCRFGDVEALNNYISSSRDPMVGIWDHYDQDSPALRVSSKVRYTIAVVPAVDEGYEIIFIRSTDNEIRHIWKPLTIKGRFYNTGFDDIYNLDWYDMNGTKVDTDATVCISGGNMLTLRFPYWDTTVRYVKKNVSK